MIMVNLVTGFAGESHITSADDGALNQAIIGRGCFVLEGNDANGWGYFGSEIIDNNTVRIHCGEGVMDGRHFRIEPGTFEDVKIDNGQAGMQRYDIIVVTYEKDTTTGIESAYLEVIKGTPKASYPSLPTYENGDIYQGATKCRFRLYDVFIDGVELKSVTRRFKIQCSLEALDRFVGDSEYMKVEGIIDSNTVTQAIGELGNYVHDLNSNFDSFKNFITSSIGQQSEPILDRINNSMSNFGTFGAVSASDAPTEGEWCILWFGSNSRINVIASDFGGNNSNIYIRSIFCGNWITSWNKC